MNKLLSLLLALALVLSLCGCAVTSPPDTSAPLPSTQPEETEGRLREDGQYNSKEEVALYIHLYGRLPQNYVTKAYAKNTLHCATDRVEDYWPGGAIGGDVFQNREGRLPAKPGRTWTECDINTWGKPSRGAERIVFSNDGLVYYTADHYDSFQLLYGDPDK